MSSTVWTKKIVEVTKNEIWKRLAQEDLVSVPLLVFANKQDIGLLSVKEVISKMELENLKGRSWHCRCTSASNGNGLMEGFTWLINNIEALSNRNAEHY